MALPTGQTTGLDFTSFDNALKLIYSKQAVVDETYKNRPLHGLLPKDTDFSGRAFVQDVITSLPQGRSATFANAQANKSGLQVDQFTVTRAYDFAMASVDMWTMYASADDKGALLDALTQAINGARGSLMRSAAIAEYRDGSGKLAVVGALSGTGATQNFTVATLTDITCFEKSQSINFYTAANFSAGTATQYATGAAKTIVQKVDRVNGIVYCDFIPTNPVVTGAIVVGDGDYGTTTVAGIAAFNKITGLDGWLPAGGPSATAFFGLDRTSDTVRLGGWSSSQIGKAEDEAILNASYECFMYGGGSPTHGFVSPNRFNNIAKLLGPQRRYVDVKASKGTIGFQALEVQGQGGMIKVLADPNCPDNRGYLLTLDEWRLKTLGAMPRFLNPNSKTLLEPTANRVEIRVGYGGNIINKAPGHNAAILFAA
jgi:hypothetical protein